VTIGLVDPETTLLKDH